MVWKTSTRWLWSTARNSYRNPSIKSQVCESQPRSNLFEMKRKKNLSSIALQLYNSTVKLRSQQRCIKRKMDRIKKGKKLRKYC